MQELDADISMYVINLRRRQDRREVMETQLNGIQATFTSDWEGPFDGLDLDHGRLLRAGYDLFDWPIDSVNPWWSRPLKWGEVGCTLSHLACWAHSLSSGSTYTVVLEDDAVLVPAFAGRLMSVLDEAEKVDNFDLLYLGRYPLAPDQTVSARLVVPGYSHCTFGYVVRTSTLPQLLATRLDQAIIPIDEFLSAMYVDHPRLDVRRRFPRQASALACLPPLVTQRPKADAGSDTEDTPYVEATS